MTKKSPDKWQYGDFQTPYDLAQAVVWFIHNRLAISPRTVLEPSCGEGSFLLAATKEFVAVEKVVGYDINQNYVMSARRQLLDAGMTTSTEVVHADFFSMDWNAELKRLPQPVLILGNPPWVTSAELGMLGSSNLPSKSNFQRHRGIEAITGKSNFDISESMLLQYVNWLSKIDGFIAVLCKTSVARKVMRQIWRSSPSMVTGSIYRIDAKLHFGASVEACLFVIDVLNPSQECKVFRGLSEKTLEAVIGFRDGNIVKDTRTYDKWRTLRGQDPKYVWRSGIKHDCSQVMELKKSNGGFLNGLGEYVALENEYVFPLLKSSDIGNGRTNICRKYVLVTQTHVGEDTQKIREVAPQTWEYLMLHKSILDRRASSIYRAKPSFSVFGVGAYTFSKWKIAISGLYKKLQFALVEPFEGRPVVLDDTVYFLSLESEAEARYILSLLESAQAHEFLDSMIFWDEKRPITADILRRLSLKAVAAATNSGHQYSSWVNNGRLMHKNGQLQLSIGEKLAGYEFADVGR